MPNVVRPGADGAGADGWPGWSVGPPGMVHIMTSFAGEDPDTRFGERTMLRLWASIRFVDERKVTSCIKSEIADWYLYTGLKESNTHEGHS
jgi:hypothetical protein